MKKLKAKLVVSVLIAGLGFGGTQVASAKETASFQWKVSSLAPESKISSSSVWATNSTSTVTWKVSGAGCFRVGRKIITLKAGNCKIQVKLIARNSRKSITKSKTFKVAKPTPATTTTVATTTTTTTTTTSTTTSTTTTTSTIALTCATGGSCAVGETGPGGGIVIYAASGNFTSQGSPCSSSCKYLEAAPNGWGSGSSVDDLCSTPGTASEDPLCVWSGNVNVAIGVAAQGTAIGTGYANTQAAVAQSNTSGRAITAAWDYSNNGKTDWYLPSRAELNELCKYARQQASNTGTCDASGALRNGFTIQSLFAGSHYYAHSLERNATDIWLQDFRSGSDGYDLKSNSNLVRPIRAF